jgi:hypothetical protein
VATQRSEQVQMERESGRFRKKCWPLFTLYCQKRNSPIVNPEEILAIIPKKGRNTGRNSRLMVKALNVCSFLPSIFANFPELLLFSLKW